MRYGWKELLDIKSEGNASSSLADVKKGLVGQMDVALSAESSVADNALVGNGGAKSCLVPFGQYRIVIAINCRVRVARKGNWSYLVHGPS